MRALTYGKQEESMRRMNVYQQYCVGGFPTLNIDLSAIDLWYIVW